MAVPLRSYEFNPYNISTEPVPFKSGVSICGGKTNVDGGSDILSYAMEYAEDSTKENPKVKVIGKFSVSKEEYSEIISLKDIDLTNVSKFELQALDAHLSKTNPNYRNANIDKPVSAGIVFEFGKRYDALSLYQRDISI